MLISEAAPQGWNRSSIELLAKPVGRLTYVFDGAVHAHQPFLAPMLDEYWMRVRIKWASVQTVIRSLLSPPRTTARLTLPWWELGVLS